MNIQHLYIMKRLALKRSLFSSGKYFRCVSEGWLQKAQIKQKNVRHTNLLSRRHFEAVTECCAQSLPVAASVSAGFSPAQFDKLLLSPSSRGMGVGFSRHLEFFYNCTRIFLYKKKENLQVTT